ncbi:MAG: hypothetical protein MZW92_17360 [Comamonadaceae bacterium]|nr:hypothetical protein [Comamonadaceae bacterium]
MLRGRRRAGLPAAHRPGRRALPRRAARRRRRPRPTALMRDALVGAACAGSAACRPTRCRPTTTRCCARELALFPEWCVQREFGITWSETAAAGTGNASARLLVASALAQPRGGGAPPTGCRAT